jgi:hypothetical protein
MTRTTNARLAGFSYLFYIAVAFPGMVLFDGAISAQGTAAKLARIAEHAADVRISVLLSVLACFAAPVLAVALYGITRDEDADLAVLGLSCRVGEGVLGAIPTLAMVGLLWLGTGGGGAGAPDPATAFALGEFLMKMRGWGTTIAATFFAVGSMLFSSLLLRGRTVPAPLAWLGVLASALLVAGLPLELAGVLRGPATQLIWLPMAAFELTLAPWLLVKGAATRATR